MTTIQTEYTRDRDGFPTIQCSRCGGNGRYSYCERFGNTCMKCGGRGRQLTASAARQRKAWLEACRTATTIDRIKVGDVVIWHTSGWQGGRSIVCTVTAIQLGATALNVTFTDRKGRSQTTGFVHNADGTVGQYEIYLYRYVDPAAFVAKCKEVRDSVC